MLGLTNKSDRIWQTYIEKNKKTNRTESTIV